MSQPTQTCTTCGATAVVRQDRRGFPPDIAKRRLAKACKAAGHECTPVYRAGIGDGLARMLEARQSTPVSSEREGE